VFIRSDDLQIPVASLSRQDLRPHEKFFADLFNIKVKEPFYPDPNYDPNFKEDDYYDEGNFLDQASDTIESIIDDAKEGITSLTDQIPSFSDIGDFITKPFTAVIG
jgi:hypothetical protein